MANKRLAAAAAFAAITLTGTAIAGTNQRAWLDTADWQVWSAWFDDGSHQGCYAKHRIQTAQGFATFGLSQVDTKDLGMFHYSEDGLVWTQLGAITVQVDSYAPWRFQVSTDKERSQLTFALGAQPAPFISQVQYGSAMRIYTSNGVRTFSLAGSNQAVETLLSCVQRIVADRGGNTFPPLPPPVTRAPNVVPLPPATPWHGV